MPAGKVYLGLLHFPVRNKKGEEVASSVTPFDLHDISRSAKTYGVSRFYIIHPSEEQHRLMKEIMDYWNSETGRKYNSDRTEALALTDYVYSFEEAYRNAAADSGCCPLLYLTSAGREGRRTVEYPEVRAAIQGGQDVFILFGTGWGISPGFTEREYSWLSPLREKAAYNHLSVRSAAAIILDRISGEDLMLD